MSILKNWRCWLGCDWETFSTLVVHEYYGGCLDYRIIKRWKCNRCGPMEKFRPMDSRIISEASAQALGLNFEEHLYDIPINEAGERVAKLEIDPRTGKIVGA